MPFGSSSTRAMSRAAVETGCSRKRSRAAGSGARDVDAKAVDDVAARHRPGRAVGEAGQPVLAGRQRRVGHQLVVARLQQLAVDGADADARDAHAAAVDVGGDRHAAGHRVVRRRRHRGRADREQRPAEGARRAEVEAERLLRVELAGDRRGELAEQAARVGEVVVLEAQQPGDRAAGDEAVGKGAGDAAFADADLHLRRIEGVGHRDQRRRVAAEHQLLAAAEEDADRAVVGRERRHLHELRQLADRPVALVEQVVRLVAGALDVGDAAGSGRRSASSAN